MLGPGLSSAPTSLRSGTSGVSNAPPESANAPTHYGYCRQRCRIDAVKISMPDKVYSALDSFLLSAFGMAWAIHKYGVDRDQQSGVCLDHDQHQGDAGAIAVGEDSELAGHDPCQSWRPAGVRSKEPCGVEAAERAAAEEQV